MKITQVNSSDYVGGAARAAARLHLGLRKIGVDSELFVQDRSGSIPDTRRFQPSMRLGRRAARLLYSKVHGTYGRNPGLYRPPSGFEAFSTDRSAWGAELCRQIDDADLVNLHWIHDMLEYGAFFRTMAGDKPIVWTLHDMNPFTGGCLYSNGCERFMSQCGRCPQLESTEEEDATHASWQRKRHAFGHLSDSQLTFVTPSQWLAAECRRAALTERFDVRVIPNGLDLDTFQPRDPQPIRRIAEVPDSAMLVLVLAASFGSSRKGGRFGLELMERFVERDDIYFLVVGKAPPETAHLPRTRTLAPISDDYLLSFVYSAADIFYIPSLQDNLPNTVMESIACGTPVVGFDVGGIPDMVRPGISGELVPKEDVTASAAAIEGFAADRNRLRCLSRSARELAEREYGLTRQANRYRNLYEEVSSRHGDGA